MFIMKFQISFVLFRSLPLGVQQYLARYTRRWRAYSVERSFQRKKSHRWHRHSECRCTKPYLANGLLLVFLLLLVSKNLGNSLHLSVRHSLGPLSITIRTTRSPVRKTIGIPRGTSTRFPTCRACLKVICLSVSRHRASCQLRNSDRRFQSPQLRCLRQASECGKCSTRSPSLLEARERGMKLLRSPFRSERQPTCRSRMPSRIQTHRSRQHNQPA